MADMPKANGLTKGILAVVAQAEREAISRRTKEALQAAKRRGVRLDNPNRPRALRAYDKGQEHSAMAIVAKADAHAQAIRPITAEFRAAGISLVEMANTLNGRRIAARRGGQ